MLRDTPPPFVALFTVAAVFAMGCPSSSSTPVDGDASASLGDGAGPGAPDTGGGAKVDGAGPGPDAGDSGTSASDAGKASAGCGLKGKPTGDFHRSALDGKGKTRDYEVIVPSAYDSSKPLALAFVYHGAGGNEAGAKSFGLQNAPGAATSGIFVFPQGIAFQTYGVGWDDTCGGYDMVFFDAMLGSLEGDYCIDPKRVFVAGFSWGGDQVTALTCCRGDRIRAVGAASCTDEFSNGADYKTYNDSPCPVKSGAAIRFTHDANGDSAYPNPLFPTTSKLYQSFNACSSASNPVSPSPCQSFVGCAHPYVECPYAGLGHALPAGWGVDTWAFFAGFQ